MILLFSCQPAANRPLPTLVPTAKPIEPLAAPAKASVATEEPVPVTFTPVGVSFQAGMTTRVVTATPMPTATARPSSTPVVLPDIQPKTPAAPFLPTPPQTVPCGDQGLVFRGAFDAVNGQEITYHAYLPPCYGLDGRVYPVLYLIHGSIQTDSHWLDLGLAEYADAGISNGRYAPFIAIMPYSGRLGNMTSGGPKSVEGRITGDLIPAVDRSFCTWSEAAGRSIGGISRGGYWALEIAFRNPALFGAVAGHSSHLRFETDPVRYNPLATYAMTDLSNTRIWLDRGEKDFLRVGQDQLHDSLTEAGIGHEYRVNPGGHSDAYWSDHLPEYLDWYLVAWSGDRETYPLCP